MTSINILKKIDKKLLGIFAVCFSAFLWGLDGVALTPRLHNLDIATVVFLIHVIPFILMSILFYKEFLQLKNFTKKDYLIFVLISLFGGLIGTLSIVKALFIVNFNGLSIIILIQKLQPVFALFLAYILLKEKLPMRKYIWATIAVLSSYLITFGLKAPNLVSNGNLVIASGFSLLAAFSFASGTVFAKKY